MNEDQTKEKAKVIYSVLSVASKSSTACFWYRFRGQKKIGKGWLSGVLERRLLTGEGGQVTRKKKKNHSV